MRERERERDAVRRLLHARARAKVARGACWRVSARCAGACGLRAAARERICVCGGRHDEGEMHASRACCLLTRGHTTVGVRCAWMFGGSARETHRRVDCGRLALCSTAYTRKESDTLQYVSTPSADCSLDTQGVCVCVCALDEIATSPCPLLAGRQVQRSPNGHFGIKSCPSATTPPSSSRWMSCAPRC